MKAFSCKMSSKAAFAPMAKAFSSCAVSILLDAILVASIFVVSVRLALAIGIVLAILRLIVWDKFLPPRRTACILT